MPFSSLIFVVIIAIWAAYLIQHWIRRRDHVATARSVDRFSEAMRVLERRQAMPRVETGSSARTYLVAPSRPAHPEVTVKRAAPVDASDAAVTARPDQTAASTTKRRNPARARALRLLVGVALGVTGVTLALTSEFSWWAALAGGVALIGSIASVRASMARDRARRRKSTRTSEAADRAGRARSSRANRSSRVADRAPGAAPTGARPVRPAANARPAASGRQATGQRSNRRPARRVTNAPVASSRVRGSAPIYVPGMTAASSQASADAGRAPAQPAVAVAPPSVYDVDAVSPTAARTAEGVPVAETAPAAPQAPAEFGPQADGTWQPVAVPPPTYTLKAKAPRSVVTSDGSRAADREGVAAPTAAPAEPRSASQVFADLPFDGNALAFDEEFEELPSVRTG